MSISLSPKGYVEQISPARTFGFAEQSVQLRAQGLALGGSVKNAVVLEEGRVLNKEGLRFYDEYVRHKILDAIGDLSLVGYPVIGHYRGHRPGHTLHKSLMQLLMHDTEAWDLLPAFDYLAEPVPAAVREDGQGMSNKTPSRRAHKVMSADKTRFLHRLFH